MFHDENSESDKNRSNQSANRNSAECNTSSINPAFVCTSDQLVDPSAYICELYFLLSINNHRHHGILRHG
jgi:hypothetical protein